ncbi:MAG: hypothetical protein ACHQT8_05955 [Chlamydiales bacterium]
MREFLFCAICAVTRLLSADLEEHFKSVDNKSDLHRIRNIDFIYMVNLDQRPEKYASCVQQLEPFEIYPCRFSGVNGWELPLDVINEVGMKYAPWMPNHWATCFLPEYGENRLMRSCVCRKEPIFIERLHQVQLVVCSAIFPFYKTPLIQVMRRSG